MGKQTFTENGFTFEVDDNGTVTASGKVGENPSSRKGMGKIVPNGYDSRVHDKGHLIAAREGGPAKGYNIGAQNRTLNRGEYKTVENAEVRLANQGNEVYASKTAYVSVPGGKPDAYMINDTVMTADGKEHQVHISMQNESPAVQEAWNNESAEAFSQMSKEFDNPNSVPEEMSESEYTELIGLSENELNSVKDDFDISSTSETSFGNGEDTSEGCASGFNDGEDASDGCSSDADGGCDDGVGI